MIRIVHGEINSEFLSFVLMLMKDLKREITQLRILVANQATEIKKLESESKLFSASVVKCLGGITINIGYLTASVSLICGLLFYLKFDLAIRDGRMFSAYWHAALLMVCFVVGFVLAARAVKTENKLK